MDQPPPPPYPPRSQPQKLIPALIVVAASVLAAAPHALPVTSLGTLSYAPDDANIVMWNFWWTRYAVAHWQSPLWTDLLFHPNGTSLAFHSYPLPYSLLSLPVQFFLPGIRGLVVAFNGLVIASFVLSGLGAYLLAARVTGSRPAAVVAGIAFASLPFRSLNVSALHVLATECVAWSVLSWIVFAEAPTRRHAVMLAACFTLTFYTSSEYTLYSTVFVALWMAFHWQRGSRSFTAAFWQGIGLAVALALVACAPLLVSQVRMAVHGATISRSLSDVGSRSPALLSFVTPSRVQPVYGKAFEFAGEYAVPGTEGMRSETSIGLTILCLAALGLIRMKRDASQFWVLAALVFLTLTLGPRLRISGTWLTAIPLPYAALWAWLPPLRASHDPTRLFPLAMLMVTVLCAFGVRACLRPLRRPMAINAMAGVIAAFIGFESLTTWPAKVRADQLIDPAYSVVASAAESGAVLDLTGDLQALLAQTRHGKPVTGGGIAVPRSSFPQVRTQVARDLDQVEELLALDESDQARRVSEDRRSLEELGIQFVVTRSDSSEQLELARRLGLRPAVAGGVTVYERVR